MDKQYVNLDGSAESPPRKDYGQEVLLEADIVETKPGAADGAVAYFFIEPDSKNMDFKYLSKSQRPAAFFLDPKFIVPAAAVDKKATAKAQISIAGGDKFKFKRGKERDKSDAKAHGSLEVEVWRKVIVRLGHMKDCKPIDPSSLTADFDPVFIKLETEGGDQELTHKPFIVDKGPILTELDGKFAAPPTQPQCTVPTAFVDRIAEPAAEPVDVWYIPEEFERSKVQYIELKGLTWPMGDEWLASGKIEALDKKGDVRANWSDLKPHLSPRTTGAGMHFKHPEGGWASNQLKFDASGLGKAFDDWLTAGEGKLKLVAGINVISNVANGFSDNYKPLAIIAVRDPWSGRDRVGMDRTVVHEFGHALGLGHHELPLYDADKGDAAGTETNDKWYVKRGGQGPHCKTGASYKAAEDRNEDGTCVMLGYSADTRKQYCDKCQMILKRAPLSKLGLVTINNEKWWELNNP